MAQKGEGHGGDGVGALQQTAVTVKTALTPSQLPVVHRREELESSTLPVNIHFTAETEAANDFRLNVRRSTYGLSMQHKFEWQQDRQRCLTSS